MQALADSGGLAPPACDDPRAFVNELSCHLHPDPPRRAGDETGAVGECSSTAASVPRVTTLILARHGETDWNRNGIWQGHGDPPLNDLGREQAAALAERLRGSSLHALYSSDLKRADETAEFVARATGLAYAPSGLREIDVGSWTGLTLAEIAERFPAWSTTTESRTRRSTRACSRR